MISSGGQIVPQIVPAHFRGPDVLAQGVDGHEHRVAQARGKGLEVAAVVEVHRQDLGAPRVLLLAGVATGAHGNQEAVVPGRRQEQQGPGEMAAARGQIGDFLRVRWP